MVRIDIRMVPVDRAQDLAWTAEVTAALHDVYGFLLRSTVIGELEDSGRRLPPPERLAQVVDGRVAEAGTPLVRAREGSLILELSQFVDASTGVQVLVGFALLLKKGPEVVAWPNRLRQAWFSSSAEAEKARQDLQALHRIARIEVMEDPEPEEAVLIGRAATGPSKAGPSRRASRDTTSSARGPVTEPPAYLPSDVDDT